jgi:hypothetical protein
LTALVNLFQKESVVLCQKLRTLIRFVTKVSSVQATIPWTCIPDLESLVLGGVDCLAQNYSEEVQGRLDCTAGQPIVAGVLDHVLVILSRHDSEAATDCRVVLEFLGYLCKNVVLWYPPRMRQSLRDRLAAEGWPQSEVLGNDAVGDDEDLSEQETLQRRLEYDYLAFLQSGQHFPNWSQIRPRGTFKKDSQAKEEEKEGPGADGCDKQFGSERRQTGTFSSHND